MAVHRHNFADTLRTELHEADVDSAALLRWTGGALIVAALVAVLVTAVHRAGWGLLIGLMFGVALLVLGAMLLVVDRRVGRTEALTPQAVDDLRAAARVMLKESRSVGEMARDPRVDLAYEVPLHIEWFADYTDRLAAGLVAHGLPRAGADALRAGRGTGGEIIPPATIPYARLESEIDLLNVLVQYRDALVDLADGRRG